MPFPRRVATTVVSPAKKRHCAPSKETVSPAAATTLGGSSPRRGGIEETMTTPPGGDYGTMLPSHGESRLPPRGNHNRRRDDAFDQWDALLEREGCVAYAAIRKHLCRDDDADNDEKRRERLCSWCYEVVDHYDVDRGNVGIALSHFDRLASHGLVETTGGCGGELLLAGMTCLYIAVKLNSSGGKVFDAKQMASFCRGFFSENQIVDMEEHICQVFDWYLNPPVPCMFIDILTPLLLEDEIPVGTSSGIVVHGRARYELVQHSKHLCELSVADSFFSDKKPSSTAYAAVLVAMDLLRFPAAAFHWFLESLDLDHDASETNLCVERLHRIGSEVDHHQPAALFDNCLDCQTSESDQVEKVRIITPEKGDVPPGLKRMRQEAIAKSSDAGEATMMSSKKRRMS